MSDSGTEEPEDPDDYRMAWDLYERSRLDEYAKEVSGRYALQHLEDQAILEMQWGKSLRTERQIRALPQVPNKPYSHQRLTALDPHAGVCLRCAAVDWYDMIDYVDDWYASAYFLGQLSDVVFDLRCPVCKLFSFLIRDDVDTPGSRSSSFYLAAFPTSALYARAWTWAPAPDEVTPTMSFSIFDSHSFWDLSKLRQPRRLRALGFIAPVASPEDFYGFEGRILGAKADVGVVKSWMKYCGHNHLETCASSRQPLRGHPRILNCRTGAIEDLKDDCPYLALSYVWGEADKEEAFEHVSDPSTRLPNAFPKTVGDAMALTQEIGYTYLWVDRYCIPQNSPLEKKRQIAQMDRIYAGAEATIIAAAGNDANYGLPGIGRHRSEPPSCAAIKGKLYTIVPPDPAHELRESKWNTRGWTYQEAVLSRRRLVVLDRQIYFECSAMHCYEAMQAPLHLLHVSPSARFSDWNEPGLFPVLKYGQSLDQIFRHLASYTLRDLSYPEDILNGMLGIFAYYEQRAVAGTTSRNEQKIVQIAGIPLAPTEILVKYNPLDPPICALSRDEQFITALAWKLDKPAERRSGFPSWSWVGWYGAVLSRDQYKGYISNTHGLQMTFSDVVLHGPQDFEQCNVNLETVLHHSTQKEWPGPTYMPRLTIVGTTVSVHIVYTEFSIHHSEGLKAFIETSHGDVQCRFTFTYNHPQLNTHDLDERCTGVILGTAQRTYLAGNNGVPVHDSSHFSFSLVILVLRRQSGGSWERFGLIEDGLHLDRGPGSDLHTSRQCLTLA